MIAIETERVRVGDCRELLEHLPAASVHCVVTSIPYWGLRDYGMGPGQLGLEPSPEAYVERMVAVFRQVWRVLRPDGTLWLNIGDSYVGAAGGGPGRNSWLKDRTASRLKARMVMDKRIGGGLKPKDLVGIPWLLALALRNDGWWLRAENIWHKANPTPEAVTDRPARDHEQVFMLARSGRPTLWRHRRTRAWAYSKPDPDWRWLDQKTGDELEVPPKDWRTATFHEDGRMHRMFRRFNLWAANDYYYDQDAVKQPATGTAHSRVSVYEGRPRPLFHKGVGKKALGAPKFARANARFHEAVTGMVEDRNLRSVWKIHGHPYAGAHFATFPPRLAQTAILAGCPPGGIVLDPFGGSGTVGEVAAALGRRWILMELSPAYAELARRRTAQAGLLVDQAAADLRAAR